MAITDMCAVPCCKRPQFAEEILCKAHSLRVSRSKLPKRLAVAREINNNKPILQVVECRVEWCDKFATAHELCKTHYTAARHRAKHYEETIEVASAHVAVNARQRKVDGRRRFLKDLEPIDIKSIRAEKGRLPLHEVASQFEVYESVVDTIWRIEKPVRPFLEITDPENYWDIQALPSPDEIRYRCRILHQERWNEDKTQFFPKWFREEMA